MNIEEVKNQILKKITPTKEESRKANDFTHKVLDITQDLGHEAVVVGSIGKHTWLKGDHDIDIFVLFPKETSREDLEKTGLKLGEDVCKKLRSKPIIKYAEHPYTQTIISGYKIDVVPCYKIEKGDKIISAVDRSPLHLTYVMENLKPAQRDDVRLLKQFLKGIGVYGSDVKNLGFSGYICELLIIIYGSFESVLKDAAQWGIPQILNMDEHMAKQLPGYLYISDPVDMKRNAAAAVGSENLVKFISMSREFMEKPDKKYFFRKINPLSKSELKKLVNRDTKYTALMAKRPDVIDDTLFPQLRKSSARLATLLKHEDFHVLNSVEYCDDKIVFILLEFENQKLPAIRHMIGPPINSKHHSGQFLAKYKDAESGPFIIDDKWVAEIKRKYRIPESLLKDFLQQNNLEEKGIPAKIVEAISSAKILSDKEVWRVVKKNRNLSGSIRKRYFEKII